MITFATNEDVAIREVAELPLLCPQDQVLASGTDGAFAAGDSWTLRVSGVDFLARGVRGGELILLTGPGSRFRPPGEILIVEAAGLEWLRMRRKGFASGEGCPPGVAAGLTGVEYIVLTLRPQLSEASAELARRLGISDQLSSVDVIDPEDAGALREAAVLTVLQRLHFCMAREAGATPDIFAFKSEKLRLELDNVITRLVMRVAGTTHGRPGCPTRIFR